MGAAEAAAVTQEVAVDRRVVTVVNALEASVALTGQRIAAHAAAGADRGRRLQVPLAGVVVHQGFVGEYTGGADLHQVAGEGAFQGALPMAAEVDVIVGGECCEVGAAGIVTVEARAAVTGDAAVHLVMNQGAQVLVAVGLLGAAVVTVPVAGHYRHVLQVALAAFGADRAVMGVVHHQRLDHGLPEARGALTGQVEDGAVGHRGHAGHDDAAAGIFLVLVLHHRALPAGADGTHGRVPAEVGQVEAQAQAALQQVTALGHLVVLAIDLDHRHISAPPDRDRRRRRYAAGNPHGNI